MASGKQYLRIPPIFCFLSHLKHISKKENSELIRVVNRGFPGAIPENAALILWVIADPHPAPPPLWLIPPARLPGSCHHPLSNHNQSSLHTSKFHSIPEPQSGTDCAFSIFDPNILLAVYFLFAPFQETHSAANSPLFTTSSDVELKNIK